MFNIFTCTAVKIIRRSAVLVDHADDDDDRVEGVLSINIFILSCCCYYCIQALFTTTSSLKTSYADKIRRTLLDSTLLDPLTLLTLKRRQNLAILRSLYRIEL